MSVHKPKELLLLQIKTKNACCFVVLMLYASMLACSVLFHWLIADTSHAIHQTWKPRLELQIEFREEYKMWSKKKITHTIQMRILAMDPWRFFETHYAKRERLWVKQSEKQIKSMVVFVSSTCFN